MKFVALDLETTGLDAKKDTIIEVAAIRFEDDKIIGKFSTLVNPLRPIPALTVSITGITDEMVKDAKPFTEHLESLKEFIGDLPLLGQNIKFDLGFLASHGLPLANPQLDTFTLARGVLPHAQSYSLEILTENFGIEHAGAHRANADAIASVKLMEKLRLLLLSENNTVLEKIKKFLKKQNWSWKEFVLEAIESKVEFKIPPAETSLDQGPTDEHGLPHKENSLPSVIIPLEGKKITEGFIDPEKYDFSEKTLVAMPGTRAFYFPKHTFKLKYNYLLPEEFEKLLKKKNKFNEDEVTACIKLIIWFAKTETFETSELSLYNKEYSVINRINLDEHMDHEIYDRKLRELEKLNKIYISHSNLLRTATLNLTLGLNVKNLVVLDAIDFEKSLAKNMTTSIGVGDMEGEGEMLFGLLGIIFEKFKPADLSFPEIFIDEYIMGTREWKNASITAQKVIENFEPHIPPKLRLFRDSLNDPEKFNISVMHAIEGDILVRITPKDILGLLDEKIWQKFDNVIVNDDIVEINGEHFLKNSLKLENFEIKKITALEKPEYTFFPDMPDAKSHDYMSMTAKKIADIKSKYKNIVVVFAANGPISHFMTRISAELHEKTNILGQGVSGSNGKIIKKVSKSENVLLVNFDFALELVEVFKEKNMDDIALVFAKLPFMHPNNPYMKYIENFYGESYESYGKYSLPKAKCAILKLIRRYKNLFKNTHAYVLDRKINA